MSNKSSSKSSSNSKPMAMKFPDAEPPSSPPIVKVSPSADQEMLLVWYSNTRNVSMSVQTCVVCFRISNPDGPPQVSNGPGLDVSVSRFIITRIVIGHCSGAVPFLSNCLMIWELIRRSSCWIPLSAAAAVKRPPIRRLLAIALDTTRPEKNQQQAEKASSVTYLSASGYQNSLG